MLTRIPAIILILLAFCLPAGAATPEDAKQLLNEVIAFYQANGKEKTFAEINNPDGQFTRGELYLFVYDSNGSIWDGLFLT